MPTTTARILRATTIIVTHNGSPASLTPGSRQNIWDAVKDDANVKNENVIFYHIYIELLNKKHKGNY